MSRKPSQALREAREETSLLKRSLKTALSHEKDAWRLVDTLKSQLAETKANLHRVASQPAETQLADLQRSVEDYIREVSEAQKVAQTERNLRLNIEEELDAMAALMLRSDQPKIEYVERKVYKPMPPKEVVRKTYTEKTRDVLVPVDRIVEKPVQVIKQVPMPWQGFWSRLGAHIDRMFK